jgi:NitT/TauT family transport system permease protein
VSENQKKYIKNYKRKKILIILCQISIALIILGLWEMLARFHLINTFITSYPSKIYLTIIDLFENNNIFLHIFTTLKETLFAFLITLGLSLIISILMYEFESLAKILDPYLIMLNSLPKVALGPIIIIWIGANQNGIITMAILISLIVCIQSIYIGFKTTDKNKIKLAETFNATKKDILFRVVMPSNIKTIINSLKINISMCLIGVVMGEFLTSKAGIGYLILYGSQVFDLNLVITGIFLLLILSIFMYQSISFIEKKLDKKF